MKTLKYFLLFCNSLCNSLLSEISSYSNSFQQSNLDLQTHRKIKKQTLDKLSKNKTKKLFISWSNTNAMAPTTDIKNDELL